MLIPAIFIGSLLPAQTESRLPVRATLPPVLDTYIDPSAPNNNYGREPSLVLGNNRAILIDFPQLMWERYNGKKLKSAKLALTLSRGNSNIPLQVSLIKKRWLEGDGRAFRFDKPDPKNIPWGSATWNNAQQGRDGVKWAESGAKGSTDATPIDGLTAEVQGSELVISGLTNAVQSRLDNPFSSYGFRIESTADLAFFSGEWGQERPRLDLEWEDASPTGGDLAIMSLAPTGDGKTYTLIFKNVGTEPIDSARFEFVQRSYEAQSIPVPGPFAPGATKSFTFDSPSDGDTADPRKITLSGRLIADADSNLGNNSIELFTTGGTIAFEADADILASLKAISPGGEPLLLYQQIVARLNHFVLPFSRFIAAPQGAFARFNLALDPLNADYRVALNELADLNSEAITRAVVRSMIPLGQAWRTPPSDAAPWLDMSGTNLSWFPDTRDDGLRITGLELPAMGFDVANSPVPLWENGLISRSEVAYLQAGLGKKRSEHKFPWDLVKPGILIRALGANGETLTNTELTIYRPGSSTPLANGNSAASGYVLIDTAKDGNGTLYGDLFDPNNAWLLVTATRGGASASTWLPAWQLLDWATRGNTSLPNVELRFNLPTQALDPEQDLAHERIVTDSAKRFPAQLAALVDNDPATTVDLEPREWIEVDLGRDRIVGQVDFVLAGTDYPNLEIYTYGTSQSPDAALRWVGLPHLDLLGKLYGKAEGETTGIPIVHSAMRMRYVRVVNRGETKATFAGLRVIPVKAQP